MNKIKKVKVFNFDTNEWECKDIEIKQVFGKTHYTKLKPNPKNNIINNGKEQEEATRTFVDGCEPYYSIKERLKNGETPFIDSVPICPVTGVMWNCHTKLDALHIAINELLDEKFPLDLDSIFVNTISADTVYDDNISEEYICLALDSFNLPPKKEKNTPVWQYKSVEALMKSIYKKNPNAQYHPNTSIFKKPLAALLNIQKQLSKTELKTAIDLYHLDEGKDKKVLIENLNINKWTNTANKIKEIKDNKKHLEENGFANPELHNFKKTLQKYPQIVEKFENEFIGNIDKDEPIMKFPIIRGKKVNPFIGEKPLAEKKNPSSYFSHCAETYLQSAFLDLDIKMFDCGKVGENGSDVVFYELTEQAKKKFGSNVEKTIIEIKWSIWNITKGNCEWYGRTGFKLTNPCWYLFGIWHPLMKKHFAVLAKITKDMLTPSKDGATLTFQNLMKQIYSKKEDYHFLLGNVNQNPGNIYEPEWKDVRKEVK